MSRNLYLLIDCRAIARSSVIITTPEKWDGVSRSWQTRDFVRDVTLIIIDEIHLLGEDRGPVRLACGGDVGDRIDAYDLLLAIMTNL